MAMENLKQNIKNKGMFARFLKKTGFNWQVDVGSATVLDKKNDQVHTVQLLQVSHEESGMTKIFSDCSRFNVTKKSKVRLIKNFF